MKSPALLPRGWLLRTLLLAAVSYFTVLPFIHHLVYGPPSGIVTYRTGFLPPEVVFRRHSLLVLILLFCSAMAGFTLGPRRGLPGLWVKERVRRDAPRLFGAGLLAGLAVLLLFDRPMVAQAPRFYPADLPEAFVFFLKGILVNDVVFRFGVLTIIFAATRHFWSANVMAAILYAFRVARDLDFVGASPGFHPFFILVMLSAFLFALAKGYLYKTRGLAACSILQAGICLRYLLIPFLPVSP